MQCKKFTLCEPSSADKWFIQELLSRRDIDNAIQHVQRISALVL